VLRLDHVRKWAPSRILEDIHWFKQDVTEGMQTWAIYIFTQSTLMSMGVCAVGVVLGWLMQDFLPNLDYAEDGSWVDDALWMVLMVDGVIIAQLCYLCLKIHRLERWGSVRFEDAVHKTSIGAKQNAYEMFHRDKYPLLPAIISAIICTSCGMISGLLLEDDGIATNMQQLLLYGLLIAIILQLFFLRHQYIKVDYLSHWTPTRLVMDFERWENKMLYDRVINFLQSSCSKALAVSALCWLGGVFYGSNWLLGMIGSDTDQAHWPAVSLIFCGALVVALVFFSHHMSEKINHMEEWGVVWVEEKLEGSYKQNAITGKGGMFAPLLA